MSVWQTDGVPDRRIRQVADVPAGRVIDDRCMNDLSRALSNPTFHDENGAVSWSSGLPTGAVTLLMTDIEGSTPMWESDSDRAAAAVALHRRCVEAAIESHNGVRPEEQGEGDSVVSAFARPSDALAAVVDLQLALGDADWGDGAVVRVRAAVHAGEISVRDERYYQGPTIIRAARIRDAGHGGQTLISAAARALVADHVPEGVSFVDLGQHRLKGLDRPDHLWQVCHPRLGSDFPPLRSLSRPANNLPTPSSPLVGREDALAELSALVASHQVVTLCGTGGCGKTRLALELAAAVAADDPARASWVPLAAVSRDDHVVSAVADALGVHEVHDEAVIETVVGELRGRCAVLVLDNCEQVLDGVSELVDRLVAALPDVHVIVTSREALGLNEERSWRVPSLDVPASVEPFVARASSVRPSFPAATEREAIEQICERLDGVPLAIELAAARTRMMSPRRIAEGLDDRFRLLTGGARTA